MYTVCFVTDLFRRLEIISCLLNDKVFSVLCKFLNGLLNKRLKIMTMIPCKTFNNDSTTIFVPIVNTFKGRRSTLTHTRDHSLMTSCKFEFFLPPLLSYACATKRPNPSPPLHNVIYEWSFCKTGFIQTAIIHLV